MEVLIVVSCATCVAAEVAVAVTLVREFPRLRSR